MIRLAAVWTGVRAAALASALLGAGAVANGCAHTHAPPAPPGAVPPAKPDHELGAETGIPVARTPQGLMRDGAEKRIQDRLRARGLLSADQCTGQLDDDTRGALRTFQKSQGLPTTGLPSYETVDHLGLDLDAIFHATPRPRDPTAAAGGAPAASR
jgi:peptidoglycan hydrolase-like protein with peptidoglycan-binding domain